MSSGRGSGSRSGAKRRQTPGGRTYRFLFQKLAYGHPAGDVRACGRLKARAEMSMAIFHCEVKTGSRKGGQSAKAKCDYILRQGRYGRDSAEVLHRASGNMPGWVTEPSDYWRAADTYERANGRLYKEVEFALPIELTHDQRVELAESFARLLTHKERLPWTLAMHHGKGTNPHAHLMINERMNDGIDRSHDTWFKRYNGNAKAKGGAKKTESLKPEQWLLDTRRQWAELANMALERAGHEARIDHRSLEAQGIDRVPGVHIGAGAMALERKGVATDRGAEALGIDEVNQDYERIKRAKAEQAKPQRKQEPTPTPEPVAERKPAPKKPVKKAEKPKLGLMDRLRSAVRSVVSGDRNDVQQYDFFEQRRRMAEQDTLRAEKIRAELLARERDREKNREQIAKEIAARKEKGLTTRSRPASPQSRDRGL